MQIVIPLVMTVGLFGALGGDSMVLQKDSGWILGKIAALVARLRNTHKGSFGSAGIVGGAHSMLGASLLAGRAALRLLATAHSRPVDAAPQNVCAAPLRVLLLAVLHFRELGIDDIAVVFR